MLWICPCFPKLIFLPVSFRMVKLRLCWQFQNHNVLWQVKSLAPITCHLWFCYGSASCQHYSISQVDGPASIYNIAHIRRKETCYSYSFCSKVTHDILYHFYLAKIFIHTVTANLNRTELHNDLVGRITSQKIYHSPSSQSPNTECNTTRLTGPFIIFSF